MSEPITTELERWRDFLDRNLDIETALRRAAEAHRVVDTPFVSVLPPPDPPVLVRPGRLISLPDTLHFQTLDAGPVDQALFNRVTDAARDAIIGSMGVPQGVFTGTAGGGTTGFSVGVAPDVTSTVSSIAELRRELGLPVSRLPEREFMAQYMNEWNAADENRVFTRAQIDRLEREGMFTPGPPSAVAVTGVDPATGPDRTVVTGVLVSGSPNRNGDSFVVDSVREVSPDRVEMAVSLPLPVEHFEMDLIISSEGDVSAARRFVPTFTRDDIPRIDPDVLPYLQDEMTHELLVGGLQATLDSTRAFYEAALGRSVADDEMDYLGQLGRRLQTMADPGTHVGAGTVLEYLALYAELMNPLMVATVAPDGAMTSRPATAEETMRHAHEQRARNNAELWGQFSRPDRHGDGTHPAGSADAAPVQNVSTAVPVTRETDYLTGLPFGGPASDLAHQLHDFTQAHLQETVRDQVGPQLRESNDELDRMVDTTSPLHVFNENLDLMVAPPSPREESFLRRLMPPVPITDADLDRSIPTDAPVRVNDPEPDSPAAISIPFGTLPNRYIRGQRYRVPSAPPEPLPNDPLPPRPDPFDTATLNALLASTRNPQVEAEGVEAYNRLRQVRDALTEAIDLMAPYVEPARARNTPAGQDPVLYNLLVRTDMQALTMDEVRVWTGATRSDASPEGIAFARTQATTAPSLYPGVQKVAWSSDELAARQRNPAQRSDQVENLLQRLREIMVVHRIEPDLVCFTLNASSPIVNNCRVFVFRVLQTQGGDLVEVLCVRILQKINDRGSSDWGYQVTEGNNRRISRPLRPYVSREALFREQQQAARQARASGQAQQDADALRRDQAAADLAAQERVARAREAARQRQPQPVPPAPPAGPQEFRAGLDL